MYIYIYIYIYTSECACVYLHTFLYKYTPIYAKYIRKITRPLLKIIYFNSKLPCPPRVKNILQSFSRVKDFISIFILEFLNGVTVMKLNLSLRGIRGFNTFSKCIYPKVNMIALQGFELAYLKVAVQYFDHYATRTSLLRRCLSWSILFI